MVRIGRPFLFNWGLECTKLIRSIQSVTLIKKNWMMMKRFGMTDCSEQLGD